jgi:WD40 repeat protein
MIAVAPVVAPPRSPFKGLSAFDDSDLDALFFFGRERERDVIVANMLASRLTVLYGESGVGKSSLLRAGVVRELREVAPTALVELHDTWSDEDPVEPLAAFHEAAEGFLILDQFEEFFLYHGTEDGTQSFVTALGDVLRETSRVHVLISLREDALAQLDAFDPAIPGIFANRLRLEQLDRDAARGAILGPVARWSELTSTAVTVEPALVDAVLDDVAPGRLDLGAGNGHVAGAEVAEGRVEAPYLQLVMERVWDEERAAGSAVLRAETLRRLGGARAIVSAHLERALGALPPHDAEIATNALKFLVTPSRTKIAHSFGDLVGYTNESPVELEAVLQVLAAQRILRAVADDHGRRYEIFHDVLAEPVLTWRHDFEARTAVERERRRHRRVAAIAVGALLVAAAMAALAVWAVAQRNEASKQRQAAQAQAELALGQKRLAQHQKAVALAQKHKADEATQAAQASEQQAKASEAKAKASEQQAKESQAQAEASEQQAKESQAQAEASEQQAKQSQAQAEASAQQAQESKAKAEQNAAQAQKSKGFALREQHVAVQQAVRARAAARRAKVGELLATSAAKLVTDPVQSIRLALSAAALATTNQVEDVLRDALVAVRARGILDGGGGAVTSAVFSPDGMLVATGAQGGQVRVFATGTHRLLHVLKEGSPIARVAFSPDGNRLAAGTRDGRALLYDARTGRLERTIRTGAQVLDLVFAGAGRYLVTASPQNVLQIWDAGTGELVRAASAPMSQRAASVPATARHLSVSLDGSRVADVLPADPVVRVYDVAGGALVASLEMPGEATGAGFSPDGRYLITTGRRNAFVWDAQTWAQLHVLAGHEAAITDLAFAPDGRVVTGSIDSSARIWDPATGASLATLTAAHRQKVLAVAFSHDGRTVATSSADATARIWKSPFYAIPVLLAGHEDAVTGVSFSPDDELVLTAGADGFARLWSAVDPALRPVGAHQGAISAVSYSPDGRLVLSGGADGTARIWSTHGGLLQALPQGGKVTRAAFVSGGREVLTAGDDGTAKLWRVTDGKLLSTFRHGAPVRGAVVVPSAGVVTAGDDGTVKLWTRAGTLVWSRTHGSPIAVVAAGGGAVATGAADGTVRLWRARDGAAQHVLRGHGKAITALAFSRDGAMLASGSADSTVRLSDARSGRLRHRLAGHVYAITSVEFSPDGRYLLSASVDGDARIWSVETGATVRLLRFHVATVGQAAFSPNGSWVVTAGPTTAGIWQVRTGRLIYFLGGADGNLTSAAFAPDSQRIVTGDTAGGVHAFRCNVCTALPSLEAQAKARLSSLR